MWLKKIARCITLVIFLLTVIVLVVCLCSVSLPCGDMASSMICDGRFPDHIHLFLCLLNFYSFRLFEVVLVVFLYILIFCLCFFVAVVSMSI